MFTILNMGDTPEDQYQLTTTANFPLKIISDARISKILGGTLRVSVELFYFGQDVEL